MTFITVAVIIRAVSPTARHTDIRGHRRGIVAVFLTHFSHRRPAPRGGLPTYFHNIKGENHNELSKTTYWTHLKLSRPGTCPKRTLARRRERSGQTDGRHQPGRNLGGTRPGHPLTSRTMFLPSTLPSSLDTITNCIHPNSRRLALACVSGVGGINQWRYIMKTQTSLNLVTHNLVPEEQRMEVVDRLFGLRFPLELEPFIYGITDRMAASYNGGLWIFHQLSNGGFYMSPD